LCLAVSARTKAGYVLAAPTLWSFSRDVDIDFAKLWGVWSPDKNGFCKRDRDT